VIRNASSDALHRIRRVVRARIKAKLRGWRIPMDDVDDLLEEYSVLREHAKPGADHRTHEWAFRQRLPYHTLRCLAEINETASGSKPNSRNILSESWPADRIFSASRSLTFDRSINLGSTPISRTRFIPFSILLRYDSRSGLNDFTTAGIARSATRAK
jgi:hypothetical protein